MDIAYLFEAVIVIAGTAALTYWGKHRLKKDKEKLAF